MFEGAFCCDWICYGVNALTASNKARRVTHLFFRISSNLALSIFGNVFRFLWHVCNFRSACAYAFAALKIARSCSFVIVTKFYNYTHCVSPDM